MSIQLGSAHALTDIVGGLVIGFTGGSGLSGGQGRRPQHVGLSGLHAGAVQSVLALIKLGAARGQFRVEKIRFATYWQ